MDPVTASVAKSAATKIAGRAGRRGVAPRQEANRWTISARRARGEGPVNYLERCTSMVACGSVFSAMPTKRRRKTPPSDCYQWWAWGRRSDGRVLIRQL